MLRIDAAVPIIFISVLVGCSEGSAPPSTAAASSEAVGDAALFVDDALSESFRTNLQDLVLPTVAIERQPGESEAVFALREADAQLMMFRKRGLSLWEEDPNNPILIEWLAATTALPPSYAIDPSSWADSEFDLKPNRSARDYQALGDWEKKYALILNQLYDGSPQRYQIQRFIRSSKIRDDLYREREVFAMRGERVDEESLLDELLAFAEEFPSVDTVSSARGGRDEPHLWSLVSILRPVLGRRDILSIDESEMEEFLSELSSIDSSSSEILVSDIESRGFKFTFHPYFERHYAFEEALLSKYGSFRAFHNSDGNSEPTVDAILYSTPTYPATNQPQNEIEATRLYHDSYVGSLMILEKGRRNWDARSATEHYDWLKTSASYGGPRFFPKNYLAYAIGLVDTPENQDTEEADYWIGEISRFTEELIQSEELSINEVQVLEFLLARRIRSAVFVNGDAKGSRRDTYEAQLFSLIERIVRRADQAPEHYGAVASILSSVYRYREDAGFTETFVKARFAALPKTNSEEIQQTIQSALNPIELMVGTHITMQAETLDGEPFDTASLKGEIVLIDHWDTNCGPCIAAMPVLHEVYERYKERGVEVVSIAYDGSSQRSRVDRIKEENGLTWITLDAEGLWPAIAAQYGYRGVPQYMLLDREGRWYAGTEEMGNGANFEALLNEILAAEAVEREASTVR